MTSPRSEPLDRPVLHPRTTPRLQHRACQFRDLDAEYTATDADVWGVSKDSARATSASARSSTCRSRSLPIRSASIERYGAWGEKTALGKTYMGVIRSTFLIDPDGRVARAWPKVKADGHAAEVLEALGEERAARAAG